MARHDFKGLPLRLTIQESPKGWFVHVIYGDGDLEGSLLSWGGPFSSHKIAAFVGLTNLEREIQIRECEHDWVQYSNVKGSQLCSKCKIHRFKEDE